MWSMLTRMILVYPLVWLDALTVLISLMGYAGIAFKPSSVLIFSLALGLFADDVTTF